MNNPVQLKKHQSISDHHSQARGRCSHVRPSHCSLSALKIPVLPLFAGSLLIVTLASASPGVEGIVSDGNGKPLKGAAIRLEAKSPNPQTTLVKTDGAGKYRFDNVTAGVYRVTVLSGSNVQAFIDNLHTNGVKNARVDFDIKPAVGREPGKAKHLVWVPSQTGTHIGGYWVDVNDSSRVGIERVEKKSGAALETTQRNSSPRAFQGAGGP